MSHISASLITKKEVLKLTSIGTTSLYKLISLKLFPASISITGTRRVAWRLSDVQEWLSSQK